MQGEVLVDGSLEVFTVTNLGRFKRCMTQTFVNKDGQVGIRSKAFLISNLVLMARDGLSEPPQREGARLTADHINGKESEFFNRVDNLEWRSMAEQTQNRKSRGEEVPSSSSSRESILGDDHESEMEEDLVSEAEMLIVA